MAVTPNYSWPIPVATDYVKDGWDAIADLGNAIDTTVAGLGSGLVKIATASFSAASSVSLATNTFTSTYTNYKLICSFSSSAGNETRLRFRASGTDDSSNNYYTASVGINSSNGSANWYVSPGTYAGLASVVNNTTKTAFDITIYDPLASGDKIITGTTVDSRAMNGRNIGIALWSSTAFDSLTFYPSSGTITGSYTIYGMQK